MRIDRLPQESAPRHDTRRTEADDRPGTARRTRGGCSARWRNRAAARTLRQTTEGDADDRHRRRTLTVTRNDDDGRYEIHVGEVLAGFTMFRIDSRGTAHLPAHRGRPRLPRARDRAAGRRRGDGRCRAPRRDGHPPLPGRGGLSAQERGARASTSCGPRTRTPSETAAMTRLDTDDAVATEAVRPSATARARCCSSRARCRSAASARWRCTAALPQRDLPLVGAWCFLDRFGPQVTRMRVEPHPHIGLQTVTWPFVGEVRHRDSVGSDVVVRRGALNLMTSGAGHRPLRVLGRRGCRSPSTPCSCGSRCPESRRHGAPAFERHEDLPVVALPSATRAGRRGHGRARRVRRRRARPRPRTRRSSAPSCGSPPARACACRSTPRGSTPWSASTAR